MTPKEKAIELVNTYLRNVGYLQGRVEIAKQCALICVDEMQKSYLDAFVPKIRELTKTLNHYKYFDEVKQEIEKL